MRHPTSHKRAASSLEKSRGFTLVELMVSMALSMVIVIAASYLYLSTRETQRTLQEKAYAFESARFALDAIGHDIENAGFYPEIRSQTGTAMPNSLQVEEYTNPVTASPPIAYDTPVFGCQATRYLPLAATQACGAQSSNTVDADGLVVNYYTNDALGLDIGNRADCLRQDSANDPNNSARRNAAHATPSTAANTFLLPKRPLFVSNRYSLQPISMNIEGQSISTFSLGCNGNGKSPADNTYQPMVSGIDQMRFYFLVSSSGSSRFRRANDVGTADWPNVAAVRVCLLARSLQPARLQGSTSYSITDCDGTSTAFTDGISRRVFSQVFTLKNKMNATF